MTDEEFLAWLQSSIGYVFGKYNLLQTTLITPGFEGSKVGSEEEEKRYEGNRTSAQLGDSLIPLVVRYQVLLVDGASRGSANNASTTITSRKYQEERAEFLGIKAHLKLNKRQKGRVDPTTLRLALCAIIGAVWLDCGQDFAVTTRVVQRLLIGPKLSPCVDPKALSSEEGVVTTPEFFDEWLHNYRNLSEAAPCSPLDVSRADLADSQYDLQIVSDDRPSATIIDAQIGNMDNVIQRKQRAIKSGRVHGTTNSNLAPRSDLVSLVTEPSSRREPISTHSSHMELMQAGPEGVPTPTLPSKKRQLPVKKAAGQASISDHLSDYMRLENERCQSLGLPFSPNAFDKAMKTANPNLREDDTMFIQLKMFYFAIGSVESLASLKSMVEIGRRSIAGKQPTEIGSLTTVERMKLVERLNTKIAYHVFERRYHIYHLLVDSRVAHQKTSDGFVNSTRQSISTNSAPRMGNPQNLDDSQLSKNILKTLHPALIPGTFEYKKKLRSMGNIRKLGERFEILVEKFGYSIIGLLPLPVDDLAAAPDFNASDSFILSIRDGLFTSVVQCLENLKGKVLRDTSRAVYPIVTAVFENNWNGSKIYAIEQLEQSQILQHPSGSQKLLELISS